MIPSYKIKMLRHSKKKAIKGSLDILKLIERLLKMSLCTKGPRQETGYVIQRRGAF